MKEKERLEAKEIGLPERPYAILINDGEEDLDLEKALKKIISFEEERRGKLSPHNIPTSRHGISHPRSSREIRDIRKSWRKEVQSQPLAIEYPLIRAILASSPQEPSRIPANLSPLSDKYEVKGTFHPFYYFICNRPVDQALEILKSKHLPILWEVYNLRVNLQKKIKQGEITNNQVIETLIEFGKVKLKDLPEEIEPWLREISQVIPLNGVIGRRSF